MAEKIRVLIVDDLPETRENVRKLLQFEPDVEVVGHAGGGSEAVEVAQKLKPDIILMDINMPDSDGIAASQQIKTTVPESQVIIMSVQSEADYLRRAMLAGARDFLMKPFSGDELIDAVRNVYETRPILPQRVEPLPQTVVSADGQARHAAREGNIITVYSPKGGIGCTTFAINIAVSLAEQGYRTLLIDGSFQFGDVGVMLDTKSMTTIIDVLDHLSDLDRDLMSTVVTSHPSGLKILLAPPRPEMAELVGEDQVRALIAKVRQYYDFLVIDTGTILNDVNLALLDLADRLILITQQNLTSLKNVSRFFDLSNELEYEREKVMLVVNHGSNKLAITVKDVVNILKWPVVTVVPEDEAAYLAADQGRPLVSSNWRRRPGAKALRELSEQIQREFDKSKRVEDQTVPNGKSFWARILGR